MPKNNTILTSEQIQEVEDNPETYGLAIRIAYIAKNWTDIKDKKRELSLDTVLNVCSKITGTPADRIRGRKNDKLYLVQYAFHAAAFCYTGLRTWEIAQCSGCYSPTVSGALKMLPWLLEGENRFVVMAVMLECEQLSGGRVTKNIKGITIEDVKDAGAEVDRYYNAIMLLDAQKIKNLPLRSADWFSQSYPFLYQSTVMAYRMDGKRAYSIKVNSDALRKMAYEMQNFGWRFLPTAGASFIDQTKDCKSCHLGRSGKCPAAVMESYFCPKREYGKKVEPLDAIPVLTMKNFRQPTYN